ncbi:MAG: ferrous iron transport protein B [Armatimonadetes bacterium]|nr:ferrous iron transport protein B [Armatimonadota bacterium]
MRSKSSANAAESAANRHPLIVFAGNPNAGKTTLFNALTGSSQKVGNYPGVTVERVSSEIKLNGQTVEFLDVPGLYSLDPVSEDERVAVGAIQGAPGFPRPDVMVVVIDASNFERNLYLFSMLAETQIPIVVALSMEDRYAEQGFTIDHDQLQALLGVEVISAAGGKNAEELKQAIWRCLQNPRSARIGPESTRETEITILQERLARQGADLTRKMISEELTNPTNRFDDAPEIAEAFARAREKISQAGKYSDPANISDRYKWSVTVEKQVTRGQPTSNLTLTDRIDRILIHRVFGLAIFIGLMYLVFFSIYTLARPVMDAIQGSFDWAGARISPSLAGVPIIQSLLVDGLLQGVGSVMVFLPQILILFFFIAMLEGTGYLSRAAFLMDRLLGWCGLNGRAFIPLLSSFACAVPGILAARVLPDQRSRLATILVAPLMSCSARLPVYLLLIGAFIEPSFGPYWAGLALFAMHLVGLAAAVPIVWFINKKMLKGNRLPFILELPPYEWPRWRDVWLAMYFRARVFVKTAGTIIVVMSVIIWGLTSFPNFNSPKQERLSGSYLASFGRALEPAFRPAGFDWRITTAILSAFPARETVVPSLGIIFRSESEDRAQLSESIKRATWPDGRKLISPATAIAIMVFFALCCQCMSTLAAIKRETNSLRWPLFVFTYMTVLAYISAVACQWAFGWIR